MSIKKSSLQQALIDAKEIEQAAYNSARKALEETLSPRIEQAVKETLMELEKETVDAENSVTAEVVAPKAEETVKEGVKIEVEQGADINVSVNQDGSATITAGANEGSAETATIETPETIETPNTDINMDENTMEEEMYEVEGISEEEVPADAPTEATPALEAPIDAPAPATSENPFEVINQKLDAILNKVETGDESGEGAEGEVEIVDDETAALPAAEEAPIEAPAPGGVVAEMGDMEEEMVYELEDGEEEGFVRETDGGIYDEINSMEEIEIVDEEEIEEDSQMRRHRAGQREKIGQMPLGKFAPHSDHATSLRENKKNTQAHNESALDELKQENESLKKTIKEYKESFVVLRKQINEVQVFNAKLAFANKLYTKGGLTNDEKIRIAEEFDKIGTVEEAKKLYNRLISEVSEIKTPKASPVEKLKTAKPNLPSAQPAPSQTLYESDEMKRMKRLAGLLKENTEA
jgi:hypothetical protein